MITFYDFSEPAAPPTFESDANTLLLIQCEGADGSTTFTDSSSYSRTVSTYGNAQVDTDSAALGSASLQLDGSGDYLDVPYSADWQFGTSEFTIECFAQFATFPNTWGLIGNFGTTRWDLYYTSSSLRFRYRAGGTTKSITYSGSAKYPEIGEWRHYAVDRDASGVIRMYCGGVVVASTTDTGSISGGTGVLEIGRVDSASYFDGRMDGVRISNVARYGGAFTPIAGTSEPA